MKGFALFLFLLVGCSQTSGEHPTFGRYQLVAGKFQQSSGTGEVSTVDTVFRVDTATGQVWRFEAGMLLTSKEILEASKNGTYKYIIDKWEPIKGTPDN